MQKTAVGLGKSVKCCIPDRYAPSNPEFFGTVVEKREADADVVVTGVKVDTHDRYYAQKLGQRVAVPYCSMRE